jgi:hypothetical protein
MKKKTVVADICFPDDPDKHIQTFIDLLEHYNRTDGGAGKVVVEIGVEDNEFVIKVMKGFDCIYLPLDEVKKLLEKP